jgi:Tol biopolymer transport system component
VAAGRHRATRVWAALAALALLSGLAAEAAPAAFPGKPGPIVYLKKFTREVDGGRHERTGGLFLRGPRVGEPARQITFDPDDHRPAFSPDGRKIVFMGAVDRFATGIYAINRDGSGRRLVADDGMQPAFFPDSRRIVFMRDGRIFSILIDGTGLRRITSPPFPDHEPVVSPDGKTVAFVKDRKGNEDIFVVSSHGGKPRVLVDLPADADDVEYAPDGRRIAFTSNARGCGTGIYVAQIDGSHIRRITPCEPSGRLVYTHPAFSPDGRHVAALLHDPRGNVISLIRSDGGGIVGTVDRGHRKEAGLKIEVYVPGWGPRLQ